MDASANLGWVSGFDLWEVAREHFPSKVGGFPAWLSLNLPSYDKFLCTECGNVLTFCLQIYAPDDNFDHSFHRTLFFFICQPCGNNFIVLRSQLPRENEFFGYNPLEAGVTLDTPNDTTGCCSECGLPAESTGLLHKRCEIAKNHKTLNSKFPEYIINISSVEENEKDYSHENQLYQKYIKAGENDGGEPPSGDTSPATELGQPEDFNETFDTIEEERYNNFGNDTAFDLFNQVTGHQDVVYYNRNSNPLWVSSKNRKLGDETLNWKPPKCENCGGERTFEFQVLPQLLHYLENDRLEFSSIAIYTCSNSCNIDGYVNEFVRPEYEEDIRMNGKWKGVC